MNGKTRNLTGRFLTHRDNTIGLDEREISRASALYLEREMTQKIEKEIKPTSSYPSMSSLVPKWWGKSSSQIKKDPNELPVCELCSTAQQYSFVKLVPYPSPVTGFPDMNVCDRCLQGLRKWKLVEKVQISKKRASGSSTLKFYGVMNEICHAIDTVFPKYEANVREGNWQEAEKMEKPLNQFFENLRLAASKVNEVVDSEFHDSKTAKRLKTNLHRRCNLLLQDKMIKFKVLQKEVKALKTAPPKPKITTQSLDSSSSQTKLEPLKSKQKNVDNSQSPIIASVTPVVISLNGGIITLAGKNLNENTIVKIGGFQCKFSVMSKDISNAETKEYDYLIVKIPAMPSEGLRSVEVINPTGYPAKLEDILLVTAAFDEAKRDAMEEVYDQEDQDDWGYILGSTINQSKGIRIKSAPTSPRGERAVQDSQTNGTTTSAPNVTAMPENDVTVKPQKKEKEHFRFEPGLDYEDSTPVVTSVNPVAISLSGKGAITISGLRFSPHVIAKIGGRPCKRVSLQYKWETPEKLDEECILVVEAPVLEKGFHALEILNPKSGNMAFLEGVCFASNEVDDNVREIERQQYKELSNLMMKKNALQTRPGGGEMKRPEPKQNEARLTYNSQEPEAMYGTQLKYQNPVTVLRGRTASTSGSSSSFGASSFGNSAQGTSPPSSTSAGYSAKWKWGKS